MLKSLKLLTLSLAVIGSLFLGPITTVRALTYPAEINKSFTPISITSGGTSRLRVTIYNPNANPLTSAEWDDNLIGVQPGLSIANPPNVVQTCSGTVTDGSGGTVDPGDTAIRLSGGTVPGQVGSNPGSCYVEVSVTSTTPGNLINTIPANELSSFTIDPLDTNIPPTPVSITNTTPASATLNVVAVQPPSVSKGFAPNTIFVGQLSTLTITIRNNDLNAALTNTTFTDTLPTGVVVATPLTASLTGCGAGTLSSTLGGPALAAGDTAISLNNGTIARNSNCVITVAVTSVLEDAYTNTIPAGPPGSGSVQTQQGVTNASPASANLNVQAFNLSKAFSPSTIAVGGVSQLTITIQNPANFTYTGVAITDNLPTDVVIASPVTTSATGCGSPSFVDGTGGSLDAGDTSLRMTGGDIAPNSSCVVTVNVTAAMDATEGTVTNTIPAGAMTTDQGNSNHLPATANLTIEGLEVVKAFSPPTFAAGTTSTLTITVRNPSPNPFTGASLSDTLPTSPNSNLRFTGTPTTTCTTGSDGAAVALSGLPTRTVTLTSGTIPGGSIASPGTCTIIATVTTDADDPAAGPYTNTIPANNIVTAEGGTNSAPASANVSVTTVSVAKSFGTSPIVAGQNSTVTITITNPATGGALTGIDLIDTLPTGLTVSGTPASPQCNGGVVTSTTTSVTLTGGSLPAGPSSCTLTFTITALSTASAGTYTNTIPVGDLDTNEGPTNSNSPSANITVNAVSIIKAFSPTNIQANGTSTLTITLRNPTGSAYTDVNFTDTLPAGLSVAASPVPINNCGGSLENASGIPLAAGHTAIQLVGGTIPASPSPPTNATCTIIVPITGTTAGSYPNSIPIGGLTTDEGPSNVVAANATLNIYPTGAGVTLTKTFLPTAINVGQNSRLQLTVTAPADTDLNNFSITDDLPGDLTVSNSTAPTVTGCGVTVGSANFNPQVGDTIITLTGGTVTRGTNCVITVYVTSNTGSTAGVVNQNRINPGDITNTETRSIPSPVNANLTVRTVSTLTASKAFYPPIVNPGGLSTLTITLTNTGSSPLVNLTVTDNLPAGVEVAPSPNASTTCGAGTLTDGSGGTLNGGDTSVRLNAGTIPAQVGAVPGLCTITFDVRGLTSGTRTNTIPTTGVIGTIQGTSSTMNAQAAATAVLTVQNLAIEIVKGFVPQLVYGGAVSTLNIELRNPNTAAVLTGITFVDNMPAGMIIADPPLFTPSAVGDCGPGATITGTPGTNTFTFSGGTLDAGEECTMSLSVTMTVNGNLTNTIPAGAVTTFNGVSNGTPTSASLTNLAGASIEKSFAPNPVASGLGSYSILTITIRSTANVALTDMGLVDNLPTGLQVAGGSAPAPTNACGGNLEDGSGNPIAPGDTTIQLIGGTLPIGFSVCTITVPVTGANPGVYTNTIPPSSLTNNEGVSNQSPAEDDLTLTPYSLGNRVWYDANNNGFVDSGESGIPGVRVELYRDSGSTPGVFDAGDVFVGFETTDATGYYRFDDLGADNYVVVIPADNFRAVTGDTVPGDPLEGYLSSGSALTGTTITDSFNPDPDDPGLGSVDNDDNGGSSFTGLTLNYVAAQAVTLGSGPTEPTGEADPSPNPGTGEAVDNQSDRTVDFGFYRLELGNQIFNDLNNDGIFNAGDSPLPGATVQLYASNGTTEINVGPDGILGTSDDAPGGVMTGAGGTYLFSGLPAGDYIVRVTPPSGYSTIDTGDSADSANPNNNVDNNDNGIGTTPGQVSSNVVTLTPGVTGVSTTVDNATATTSNPSVDFGFVPLYSLGNRVWFDTNNNSTLDGAEVGINNVRVELYLDDGDGVYDAGDSFVAFDTTDTDGYYRFDNLNPGNYVVVIPNNQFTSGGRLENYWSSGTSATDAGVISDSTSVDPDNDVDSEDNGITTFTGNAINYVSSQAVTLGPGLSEPTNDNDPTTNPEPGEAPNNQSNRTVDFGFYQLELGNQIFWDVNADGTFGGGDTPIDGATVRLFTGDGLTELDSFTTGVDGQYLFSGMPAGNYVVRVTPPAGFESTIDSADTTTPNNNIDDNDNGVGTGAGEVSSNLFAMIPGDAGSSNVVTDSTGNTQNPSLDFGFIPDSTLEFSLGNRVWFDTNNNGLIDGTEAGVNNVRVELYQDNGTTPGVYDAGDTFLAFDNTDASGHYRFDDLPAGQYVVVIPTSQFGSGGPLDGYLSSGTTITNNGTVNDSIGPDPDANATDSDDNGTSTFVSSTLSFVSSQAVTLGPSTVEPTGETDALPNPDAGEEPDNQSNRTVDFGFYRLQLSNQIFIDVDNDGIYNPANGDLPLAGAQVQLFTGDGLVEIRVGVDGVWGTADDAVGGVTTGPDGQYLFSGLPAGDYIVRVTPPAGYASTADVNPDTNTPNNNINNNDNGIGVNTGQVSSNPVSLVPGVAGSSTTVTNSTGTTHNPSMDFGFTPTNGFLKTIAGTDQPFTTGANVAIGEIITYQITVDLTAGTPLTNVVVTDNMDKGLAFVDCDSVVVDGVDITASVCPPTVSGIGDPTDPGNAGRQVIFNIGNIAAPTADTTMVIRYEAIVLDIIENQSNVTINNSATVTWTGGSLSSSAPNVTIVEPDLSIDKSATPDQNVPLGAPIQFTLVIDHTTPESQTDAFDVIVTDILPPELEYVQCTVQYTAGIAPTTPASDYCNPGTTTTDLIFFWDVFPLGQTSTITFTARLIGTPATNASSVAWTSLPIDPQLNGEPVQLSIHNTESTERWYDPLDPVDIYSVIDSITINQPAASNPDDEEEEDLPSVMPATGFAPGVMTRLPAQPAEKAYASTDVWLEIPSLGVNMPVVGVPLSDGEWDVSWLWRQAGWLDGTAFPGWKGNSVLTGHVVLPNGNDGPFAALGNLNWGDRVIVHAYGSMYIYEVRQNQTISPYNMTVMDNEEDAWLTLITCKNYNEATDTYANRIAVRAVLIKVQSDTSANQPGNIR
ncbi:MAG: sortase [Anaerolineales bacterium]|nr:sortase [Anaerolineales bacterium]